MLDINLFRDNPDLIRETIQKRAMDVSLVDKVIDLDKQRRELLIEVENMKAERNAGSKAIGRIKDKDERDAQIKAMRELGDKIKSLDDDLKAIETELNEIVSEIPNILFENVPAGASEADNVVIREVGEKPSFDFEPKAHWDLGPELGIVDFEQGAKISGTRFYVLNGAGARLQRAMISWMLDLHIKQGYYEKYTPYMVREATMFAAGELPKFKANLYRDAEEDFMFVPTAEVPLTGIHIDDIIPEEDLPIRYTAYTACFRREKMSAGRDVRGMKRGHQFDKVEMYKYLTPEQAEAEFEQMIADAEQTCALLGLPYRVLLKCAGDTAEKAHISYDIDVWAAGAQEWLEVSSVSLVGDYQARRANVRYRPAGGGKPKFAYTINGSGLGLPRAFIAVLENNQQADGTVKIPKVLQPFMGGMTEIKPEK